jgi:hypothetical protein
MAQTKTLREFKQFGNYPEAAKWSRQLRQFGDCPEAAKWVSSRPLKRRTLACLWQDCPDPQWMLWWHGHHHQTPDLPGLIAVAYASAMLANDVWSSSVLKRKAQGFSERATDAAHQAVLYAQEPLSLNAAINVAFYASSACNAAAVSAFWGWSDGDIRASESAMRYIDRQCADMVRLLVRPP